ncbi:MULTISPECIES: nicotinate-nucleotide--dimethylbenzimidazole phosphoribosyltransferase [unclassified Halomonas]|uniref:nicotinate-nucleotide--dimethylbenzimidazole phosphoribosyltransferase n=1 Tax=unclassified Halomonas TaxID=2609666 RepID=UPI002883B046|nr:MULTISPECIES: nicotinate-nucleotide--dimethylbenzimidazole phosphoribosyltransferase [unclassified Halomonas]MDT0502137.1 nicotinate-nucleotide--dimethylbenzimidazole phosphoribosyltransferase [Halomonas sp. PAR7]MDT0510854.1 nicotinate-nucleotide--dimethylbenzimidazole phosphoribosyltransferase [Halomonas sp. LES1]MDT0591617.1 nicotinate-nucleotide--dimethylbenzimidazole phosphoribosyltransferase [Halomonas sp. PAR8]
MIPDRLPQLDSIAAERAVRRLDRLTKPPGSLGRLERLAVELAAIQGQPLPQVTPPAMLVFAADHGVAAEGVSAFPQEVTAQMVANFTAGGAAINVFARQHAAHLEVIDVGVATPLPEEVARHPLLVNEKVRLGTANMLESDAMTRDEALQAMAAGARAAKRAAAAGCRCLIIGEMGIANTTASSALLAVLTGGPVAGLVGNGTGLDASGVAHKQSVIERVLAARRPDRNDPLGALAAVGGLEIAAMAGAFLGGAEQRLPLLVDGFIATVAALVARRLCPGLREYLIFGHRSQEPGHEQALKALDARPLLDFGLRLGEGTGAALAFPLLDSACRLLSEMATFDDAGIGAGS